MVKAKHENNSEGKSATWFVYILRCADGSLCTGITTDLKEDANSTTQELLRDKQCDHFHSIGIPLKVFKPFNVSRGIAFIPISF